MRPQREPPIVRPDEVGMELGDAEVVDGLGFAGVEEVVDGGPLAVVAEQAVAGLEVAGSRPSLIVEPEGMLGRGLKDASAHVQKSEKRDERRMLRLFQAQDHGIGNRSFLWGFALGLNDQVFRSRPFLVRNDSSAKAANREEFDGNEASSLMRNAEGRIVKVVAFNIKLRKHKLQRLFS